MQNPSFKDRIAACKEAISASVPPIATATALAAIAGSAQAAVTVYNVTSPSSSCTGWAFDPLDGSYAKGADTALNPIAVGQASTGRVTYSTSIGLAFAVVGTATNLFLATPGTVIDSSEWFSNDGYGTHAVASGGASMYLAFRYRNPASLPAGDYYGWVEFSHHATFRMWSTLTRFALGGLNEPVAVGQVSSIPEPAGTLATFSLVAGSLALRRRKGH